MGILEEFFDKKDAEVKSQLKDNFESRERVYSEGDKKEWINREIRSLIVSLMGDAEERTRRIATFFNIDPDELWDHVSNKLDTEVNWNSQSIESGNYSEYGFQDISMESSVADKYWKRKAQDNVSDFYGPKEENFILRL